MRLVTRRKFAAAYRNSASRLSMGRISEAIPAVTPFVGMIVGQPHRGVDRRPPPYLDFARSCLDLIAFFAAPRGQIIHRR